MKRTVGFLVLAILLATAACIRYVPYGESGRYPGEYPYDRNYDRDYDRYDNYDSAYFYDELEPYGLWVTFRPYGYVWVPRYVGYNWRPYSQGHWVWTDYGWTWVSVERWGWIAFHYGRWGFDRRLGWFWVPDAAWGPAWVAWRWGDAHIGWAPLPPGVDFVPGRGFGRHQWDIPESHWNFVYGRYFLDRSLDRRVLPIERNRTIIDMTDFRENIGFRDRHVTNDGVDIDYVRRETNRTEISRLSLKDSNRPGGAREEGRDLVVFRPEIRRNETARPRQAVDESRAERQLQAEESGRIFRRVPRSETEALREDHDQERQLMRESQETEIAVIRRQAQEEEARVQKSEEKQKIQSRVDTRLAELKKKHDQEKADLEKRQKDEEEKTPAKRTPIKKTAEPVKR